VPVNVVATPDTITVKNEETSKNVAGIELTRGKQFSLTALAEKNHIELIADDKCFKWTVTGILGP
jgi:hypothetical protein